MYTRFALWTALPLLVFGILAFFFLSGESKSSSPQKTLVIVAFGDSLTEGFGVTESEAYPAVLERRLGEKGYAVRVVNAGVSGETTEGGLSRTPSVIALTPDLVLLGLGENDALRRIPPEETEKNLRAMLGLFREANIPVILLGMKSPLTGGLGVAQRFNALYPRLAEEYDLPRVEFLLEGVVLRRELNIDDGIHPNALGYQKIVEENLLPVILPWLRSFSKE